jgi:RNA polymerase sigma-70 factor, ECF subfamily
VSDRRGGTATASATAPTFEALCADDPAFTAWYETALPRVYGFVYARSGGNLPLTEDVTAQAFLEGIRARHDFDGRSDPVTWICAIARNRLIDHYRAEARERLRRLRLVDGPGEPAGGGGVDEVERRDAVLTLLGSLPDLERMALTLRYLDGYSVPETASLIGRSVPATESLLNRARERVRHAFPGGLG